MCPRDVCDCFIDQFPDDMEQAGALHPEFFVVVGMVQDGGDGQGDLFVVPDEEQEEEVR